MKNDFLKLNYTPKGMPAIRGIVFHSTWGSYAGTVSWFKNPKAQVSAHYVVSKDGEICHMVDEAKRNMAWHAGVTTKGKCPTWASPNPNWFCIGIEIEDGRQENWAYPKKQREALVKLVADLQKRYKIPFERLLTHKGIYPTNRRDPVGKFDLRWFKPKTKPIVKPKPKKETPIVPLETPQPLVVDGISDHNKIVVATQDITPKNLLERIIKLIKDLLNELQAK